jgi:hypothetical protein
VRVCFGDASLGSLDALTGVDSASLFVFQDERPLKGLAGYLDWRLCGSLSRILFEGRFTGVEGDALLFPTWGRLSFGRVFCFGAGKRDKLDREAFVALCRRAGEALSKAGVQTFVGQVPKVVGVDDVERARLFLAECALRFKGERIVLLGDGKVLAKAFGEVAGSFKDLEIDREAQAGVMRTASAPVAKAARAS